MIKRLCRFPRTHVFTGLKMVNSRSSFGGYQKSMSKFSDDIESDKFETRSAKIIIETFLLIFTAAILCRGYSTSVLILKL